MKNKKKYILLFAMVVLLVFSGFREGNKREVAKEVNQNTIEEVYKEDDKIVITPLNNDFKILRPSSNTYKTGEKEITFTGMSDPSKELLLNGEKVPVYFTGNFVMVKKLEIGENNFEFSLEGKKASYKVNREFKIINKISPEKKLQLEEGMEFTIKATLYSGAKAYAVINGEKIELIQEDSEAYINARDTTYASFSGKFTAPNIDKSKSLGKIKIIASYDGKSEEKFGGEVIVTNTLEKYQVGEIKNDSAKVYNPLNISPIPLQEFSPLPKGTLDYIKAEIILDDKEYYILKSGRRVKKEDITLKSSNTINETDCIESVVVEDDGRYTKVKIKGANKYPFNIYPYKVEYNDLEKTNYEVKEYKAEQIYISFDNAKNIKEISVNENEMFKSIEKEGNKILLNLKNNGDYLGHYSYYDEGGELNIRFIKKLKSLEGATITIDPGHGFSGGKIKDIGALGFNYINETDVNVSIAKKVEEELLKRGAKPIRLKTESDNYELDNRGKEARKNESDLFVSIHNNSGGSGEFNATETYYNTPYSMDLAKNINSSLVSLYKEKLFKGLKENFDRGAKYDYYRVTLERENPSVLVEVGYMDNPKSFNKLIDESIQEEIAKSIVNGIENYIKEN